MRLRVYAKINQGIRGAEWESETSWQRRLPFAAHPLLLVIFFGAVSFGIFSVLPVEL